GLEADGAALDETGVAVRGQDRPARVDGHRAARAEDVVRAGDLVDGQVANDLLDPHDAGVRDGLEARPRAIRDVGRDRGPRADARPRRQDDAAAGDARLVALLGDRGAGGDGGGARRIQDRAAQNHTLVGVDVDLAGRVADELHADRAVGLDRVREDVHVPAFPLHLVVIGFAAVPGAVDVIVDAVHLVVVVIDHAIAVGVLQDRL